MKDCKINILVNKSNSLDKNYIPGNLIVTDENENNFHNYADSSLKPCIRKEAYKNFLKLQKNAIKKGYHFIVDSGYRSYEYQQTIWDNMVKEKGIEQTKISVALPGTSEHQTGLAIDFATIKDNKYIENLEDDEIKYLKENSYKYGFILRYEKGKEHITKYMYEPWHYRYVGTRLSKYLYKNNLSLEEYYILKTKNHIINLLKDKEDYVIKLTDDDIINVTGSVGSGKSTYSKIYKNNKDYLVLGLDSLKSNLDPNTLNDEIVEIRNILMNKYPDFLKLGINGFYEDFISFIKSKNMKAIIDGGSIVDITPINKLKGTVIVKRTARLKCYLRASFRDYKNPSWRVGLNTLGLIKRFFHCYKRRFHHVFHQKEIETFILKLEEYK